MGLLKAYSKLYTEAGCDEVGRGCLSGPVVAASVVLSPKFRAKTINDSKMLSAKKRLELDQYIKDHAVSFSIAEVPVEVIDRHNILNASIHAMHRALDGLSVVPEFILVDGNRFHPYKFIPHQCIVKGDTKYLSIACASIIAKNYRDSLMLRLHEEFPQYGWNSNMGYATKSHQRALIEHGPCIHHRKSFRLDYSNDPLPHFEPDLQTV